MNPASPESRPRFVACRMRYLTAILLFAVTPPTSAASLAEIEPMAREQLAPRNHASKSILAAVGRAQDPRTLVVKLNDGAPIDVRENHFVAAINSSSPRHIQIEAQSIAQRLNHGLGDSRTVLLHRAISVPREQLDALRHAGELASGEQLADLAQFYIAHVSPGQGIDVLSRWLALDEVENAYAYREKRHPVDAFPSTPDLLNTPPGQGYRGPAPAGIDIDAAWAKGLRGQGVTVIDVETNWTLSHEDLDHLATQVPTVAMVPLSDVHDPLLPAQTNLDHGTASLGVLAAGDNGYGTTGLVSGSTIRVVPIHRLSDPRWNAPNAVVAATLAMAKGDVMLLEVENSAGEPFENFDLEYAVVKQATALGIHVIEPAGNSPNGNGFSLDLSPLVLDPMTGVSRFDWRFRDSGAIVVAGGESAVTANVFHYRYPNSNCGSRIDAFAWGQNISTLGYGTLSPTLAFCANPADPFPAGSFDSNQRYTRCYNGTSGASAIVAGAVAALEQKHRAKWGTPASPREMRNHLRLGTVGTSLTSTPNIPVCQGGIGHQPDLAYHLDLYDQGGLIAHAFQAEWRASLQQTTGLFGTAIASPGDVDGDGLADIAIGAPGFGNLGSVPANAGRVYLFSAKSERLLWTANGIANDFGLGGVLSALDDVDGDGRGDLAVGSPSANAEQGAVEVLSGANGTTLYTLQGSIAGDRFGAALASLGDIDGDGKRELIIGAPGDSGASARVELHSGANGTLLWSFSSSQPFSRFGFAVSALGDQNGDGKEEVIVGAPRYFDAASASTPGAITIHSGASGSQLLFRLGETPPRFFNFSEFGSAVAGAGDLDRDGVADFVVGAPGWTQTTSGAAFGKVYAFRSNGKPLVAFAGTQLSGRLGSSVAANFDWNGDHHLDIAAGQPTGKVLLYQGPFLQLTPHGILAATRVFPTKDKTTQFGTAVAVLGDTNGDRLPDIGAGEPLANGEGRAFVFASGPNPATTTNPRLVATPPAIEASDLDGDGNGGGGLSPSRAKFTVNAGTAWAGAQYRLVGVPKSPFQTNATALALVAAGSPYLTAATGTLDGNGNSTLSRFGPIPNSLLCPGLVGAEFDFVVTVGFDANGDGVFEQSAISNPATIKIIHEYFPTC